MIKELGKTVLLLITNIRFYILLFIAVFLSTKTQFDSWTIEGIKMIPVTIGVLLGGLLTSIAIIFTLIDGEHIKMLDTKYGGRFSNSLRLLKYHIITIMLSLLMSLLSLFFTTPIFIVQFLEFLQVTNQQLFVVCQIFYLLLAVYSSTEVILNLFLVFELKFSFGEK
jgi:hypothetical protein